MSEQAQQTEKCETLFNTYFESTRAREARNGTSQAQWVNNGNLKTLLSLETLLLLALHCTQYRVSPATGFFDQLDMLIKVPTTK